MALATTNGVELTPEDVLQLADPIRYELVDGQLREQETSFLSTYVATQLASLLWNYYRSTGIAYVVSEEGYTCFPGSENKMRRPDVSCVRVERLPFDQAGRGFLKIRPDLAVEVISPGDTVIDLEEKLDDYKSVGIPLVWLIYPTFQRVRVIRLEGPPTDLGPEGELTGEDVLPGFRCLVSELSAGPTATGSGPAR